MENSDDLTSLIQDDENAQPVDSGPIILIETKFTAPVLKNCNVCGEWIGDTKQWVTHHTNAKHKKVIRCLQVFRSKCIAQHDENDSPTSRALVDTVVNRISYTQELFETSSNSNLICSVCGCCVFDVEDHLVSSKHNEAYLNVLYLNDLVDIKVNCVKPTGVDWNEYEKQLVVKLQAHQPRTEESPLEIYVLKDDEGFKDWMWKFMIALPNYTQHKDITLSYKNSLEMIVPPDQLKNENIEPSVLWRKDTCWICYSKTYSLEGFTKHIGSEVHRNKVKIFDFLRFADKFELVTGTSLEQTKLEQSEEASLGIDAITELFDRHSHTSFWICGVCFIVQEEVTEILAHVTHSKHILNCLNLHYPDVKLNWKTTREMYDESKKVARELKSSGCRGKISLAELTGVNSIDSVFKAFGIKRKNVSPVDDNFKTNADETAKAQAAPTDEEFKMLSSERSEDIIWCDTCMILIQVKKSDEGTKVVWEKHCALAEHIRKKEFRKELTFGECRFLLTTCLVLFLVQPQPSSSDKENFVDEKVAPVIREALAKCTNPVVGLEDIVERKTTNADGSPLHDCVCTLCAAKFHVSSFISHVTDRSHIEQFLHKHDQSAMRRILDAKKSDVNRLVLDAAFSYSKKNNLQKIEKDKAIRVYNPARAQLLHAEYVRLTQEIAEKQRLLEKKRLDAKRQEEEEAKKAEARRLALIVEEKKAAEQRLLAELAKREHERLTEEAKRRESELRDKIEADKIAEEKRLDTIKRLEHQRLLSAMQKEKEEELKKREEQRILSFMRREKALMGDNQANKVNDEVRKVNEIEENRRAVTERIESRLDSLSKKSGDADDLFNKEPNYSSVAEKKNAETRWTPMNELQAQRVVLPPKCDTCVVLPPGSANSTPEKEKDKSSETPDVLIELLQQSTMLPIPYVECAYVQPEINKCGDPLIGLQHINEFECLDNKYEPGYFCRICSVRMMTKDVLGHVGGTDHIEKYLEHSYKPLAKTLANYESDEARNSVLRQYAAQIERQEGRKCIGYRLTMRVANTILTIKKPGLSYPHIPSLVFTPMPLPIPPPPPTFQPPPPTYYSAPHYPPMHMPPPTFQVPPPMFPATAAQLVYQQMSISEPIDVPPPGISPPLPGSAASAVECQPVPCPPPAVLAEKARGTWGDKCEQFLQKLTRQDKSSSKDEKRHCETRKSRNSGEKGEKRFEKNADKKTESGSGKKRKSTSPSLDSSLDSKKSKEMKKNKKNGDEKVLLSGPVVESAEHRKSTRSSRSRSPRKDRKRPRSPKRSRRHSRSRSRSSTRRKRSPNEKSGVRHPSSSKKSDSISPLKAKKDSREVSTSSGLTAEQISLLQQLAAHNPSALEELVKSNPEILTALLMEQNRIDKPITPPPAPKKSAFDASKMQNIDANVMLLNLLQGNVFDGANQAQPAANNDVALLLNLLAEENEKKKKQAEQQQMFFQLLQKFNTSAQSSTQNPNSHLANLLNEQSKHVYDYSHGRGDDLDNAFEIDDLIKEASANVQQAQKGKPAKSSPNVVKQAEQTGQHWKNMANDKDFSSSFSSRVLDITGAQNKNFAQQPPSARSVLSNDLEKRRREKLKQDEIRRKNEMEKLANELCASISNNKLGGGQAKDQLSDLDKLLQMARVRSQLSRPSASVQPNPGGSVMRPPMGIPQPIRGNLMENPLAAFGMNSGGQTSSMGGPSNQQQQAFLAQTLASLMGGNSQSTGLQRNQFGFGSFGNLR